tara:strand:- start:29702 stop:30037 length:336 start_codon:yes stop_codon:yes gene_type:complete
MTITKNNIKLEGNGFLPHDTKNFKAYFENDINFIFSNDKLIAMVRDITINGVFRDYSKSFYFFTDIGYPNSHVQLAKKDLKGLISEAKNETFYEDVKKVLKKEGLWKEAAQ